TFFFIDSPLCTQLLQYHSPHSPVQRIVLILTEDHIKKSPFHQQIEMTYPTQWTRRRWKREQGWPARPGRRLAPGDAASLEADRFFAEPTSQCVQQTPNLATLV